MCDKNMQAYGYSPRTLNAGLLAPLVNVIFYPAVQRIAEKSVRCCYVTGVVMLSAARVMNTLPLAGMSVTAYVAAPGNPHFAFPVTVTDSAEIQILVIRPDKYRLTALRRSLPV